MTPSDMTPEEYNRLKTVLESFDLDVYDNEECGFINYKEKNLPYVIYGISKEEDGFSVATLFGMVTVSDLETAERLLKQDWNKDNWITESGPDGEYVSLKEGMEFCLEE